MSRPPHRTEAPGPEEGEAGFLARWSRRKQAARQASPPVAPAEVARPPAAEAPAPPAVAAPGEASPLPELPDLESLHAASDFRPFLRPGVPAALRNAALRRAWALDPTIRDFREMADYDWDFNTPGAAPGYGTLDATVEELEQMLARILPPAPRTEPEPAGQAGGGPSAGAPAPGPAPAPGSEPSQAPSSGPSPDPDRAQEPGPVRLAGPPPKVPAAPLAPSDAPVPAAMRPRRHGGAVPA